MINKVWLECMAGEEISLVLGTWGLVFDESLLSCVWLQEVDGLTTE